MWLACGFPVPDRLCRTIFAPRQHRAAGGRIRDRGHPKRLSGADHLPGPVVSSRKPASPDRTVAHTGASGTVLAVDMKGLVAQAQHADGIIEFVPQVGDFVAVDEPLFRLYGGAAAIDDRQLRSAVALGSERTIEQDPTFAFRILVDIAIKALSPAINDPTTAVLAIDQLHRLLRLSVCGSSAAKSSAMPPANCGLFSGRRTGRTLCTSHAPKYVIVAREASRSCGGCVRCWKISPRPCRSIAMPSFPGSWRFWIVRSRGITRFPKTRRLPGFRIRRVRGTVGIASRDRCANCRAWSHGANRDNGHPNDAC